MGINLLFLPGVFFRRLSRPLSLLCGMSLTPFNGYGRHTTKIIDRTQGIQVDPSVGETTGSSDMVSEPDEPPVGA